MLVVFWTILVLLAYSYAGYPAMLWLVGRLAGRRTQAAGETPLPRVSLIIPAYNEEEIIEQKVRNAATLDYPGDRLEILVVDDGSSDRTAELAGSVEAQNLRVLRHSARCGKASAINTAAKVASGHLLCLCDANVIFARDALLRLVERMRDPQVGAVTGCVRLDSSASDFGKGEDLYYQIERWIQENEERLGSLVSVDGGMYVLRKELFEELPADTILDDFVLSTNVLRQGRQIRYERTATAEETGTPTSTQEYNRRVRLAAGCVQALKRGAVPGWRRPLLLWQFVSHKLLRWVGPLLLFALLVANCFVVGRREIFLATLGVQLALYAAGSIGCVWPWFRRTTVGGVAYYFLLSEWAMGVGLVRGMLNRQTVAWAKADRGTRGVAALDALTGRSLG